MNDFLNSLNIKPYKYKYINKALIIYSDKKYVLKKNSNKNKIYRYLDTTSFENFIKPIEYNNTYYLFNYIDDYANDSNKYINYINTLSNLHLKTTSIKELSLDRLKEIVEEYNKKINYLFEYYNNLEDTYNKEEFFSPCVYLLLRNISKIYYNLDFCKYISKEFYDYASKNNKYKESLILEHIDLDNYINNLFTNFDHSKFKSPVYDLINFYKKYYDKTSFNDLYKIYKENYKLNKLEELYLLLSISIPYKISFSNDLYLNTVTVNNLINYIDKTHEFIILNNKIYEKNNNDEKKKKQDSI